MPGNERMAQHLQRKDAVRKKASDFPKWESWTKGEGETTEGREGEEKFSRGGPGQRIEKKDDLIPAIKTVLALWGVRKSEDGGGGLRGSYPKKYSKGQRAFLEKNR